MKFDGPCTDYKRNYALRIILSSREVGRMCGEQNIRDKANLALGLNNISDP